MRYIKLRNSDKVAIVDDADFETLSNIKWYLLPNGYAFCSVYKGKAKYTTVSMHRFLLNTPKGMDTDHINRNRLDNRRGNLRIVSRRQNNLNTSMKNGNKTGYKGIARKKNRWQAQITVDGVYCFLGSFKTPEEAHKAYVEAHKKAFQVAFAKYENQN